MLRKNGKEVKSLIGKIFNKGLSVILLSFLMILPPFTNAYLFRDLIQQPKVFT